MKAGADAEFLKLGEKKGARKAAQQSRHQELRSDD